MARYVNCRSSAIQDDNLAGSNHLGGSSANRTLYSFRRFQKS